MSRFRKDRPQIRIAGIPVTIVPDEEAEQCDFVVCGPDSYFPDDVRSVCSDCGTMIVHRPHVPKRPRKICMTCFLKRESPIN